MLLPIQIKKKIKTTQYTMKKVKKALLIITMIIAPFVMNSVLAFDPPVPPTDPTSGGPVGSTPIDGGMSIFLLMGAAYGAKKIRK